MGNGVENSSLTEQLRMLQETQLVADQNAFDAINEHDKLMQLIRSMIGEIQEIFGNMDMVNMAIAEVVGEFGLTEEQKESLLEMNNQNAALTEQLQERLRLMLEEAELGSETIHRMEESIATVQDAMELVREAAGDPEI